MISRWAAFLVACLVLAVGAFGVGMGTVALYSDSETISGSFSIEDDPAAGNWTTNAPDEGNESTVAGGDQGSNTSQRGNGTAPGNGTNSGTNDSHVGNSSETGDATNTKTTAGDGNATNASVPAAKFDVTAVHLEQNELTPGEEATVHVTATNTGAANGTFDASLLVNGTGVTHESIGLAAGEEATLSLRHTFDSPGTHSLTTAGTAVGDVTVKRPEPDISVENAALEASTIAPNESVTLSAAVANDGSKQGSIDVTLAVGDAASSTTTVDVPANGTRTVSFEESFASKGTYAFAVNEEPAGTVTVAEPSGNSTG